MKVEDADWFTAGFNADVPDKEWFSGGFCESQGSLIRIGNTGQLRVVKVDYANDVITVDKTIQWEDGEGVGLHFIGEKPDVGALESETKATVVGRHVFYNNSAFDGNNAAANADDDGAIATDKTALLPGQTATFANYTSFSRGINGVMVDISELPGTPTAADFAFKTGNPDPPSAQTVLDANFDSGTDSFSYIDDTFRGTNNPAYADGTRIGSGGYSGGALRVFVGAVDNPYVTGGMSGGWSRTFNLPAEGEATLSVRYKLTQSANYDPDEYSEALVSVDGQLVGTDGDRLARITGDGNGGDPITTGWQHAQMNLGTLSAGDHTLIIGAYNNQSNFPDESTEMLIDDVRVIIVAASPSDWSDAPAPSSVTVRKGAGAEGSDRITIIWPDNAIRKQWLQVTVKSTSATGLALPDVFYFGNAIGETGNSASDATVKPTDEIGARNNPHTLGGSEGPAGIEDVYDFNRDRKVGPTDEIIARSNGTNSTTALKLITAP
ncbi:MAG: hypothetical protein SVV80_06635 [Planctomycetota bacterium]|nr:hypothetical protein [Planctomycetota bacterium]